MEAMFLYCVIWSIGALLIEKAGTEDRKRFDVFLKNLCGLGLVDGERVPASQLPSKSLFEYRFDPRGLAWTAWQCSVEPYKPPTDGKFSKILVPTVDVVR